MKTIELRLNKEYEEIEDVVSSIQKCHFRSIVDDNGSDVLRFVTLELDDVMIDIHEDGIELRNKFTPHLWTKILNKYIWACEINFRD